MYFYDASRLVREYRIPEGLEESDHGIIWTKFARKDRQQPPRTSKKIAGLGLIFELETAEEINPVQAYRLHFSKIHFDIVLPSTTKVLRVVSVFQVSTSKAFTRLVSPRMRHMPCLVHPPWFDRVNITWLSLQIVSYSLWVIDSVVKWL